MVGRKKNLIILGTGENVSPEELEKKLNACPEVQECVVKEMGKKIGALICCAEEKQAEVRAFITGLNRTLPLYQRITAVESAPNPCPATPWASCCAGKRGNCEKSAKPGGLCVAFPP